MAASGRCQWDGFTDEDLQKIRKDTFQDESDGEHQKVPHSKGTAVASSSPKKSPFKGKSVRSAPRRAVVKHDGEIVVKTSESPQLSKVLVTLDATDTPHTSLGVLDQSNPSLPLPILERTTKTVLPANDHVKSEAGNYNHSTEIVSPTAAAAVGSGLDYENQDRLNEEPPVESVPGKGGGCLQGNRNVNVVCAKEDSNTKDLFLISSSNKKVSLEDFQRKQKEIEEQNNRRREVLSKTIDERKRKTKAEAEKLHQVQCELQKLDTLVSNDVSVLRNQIEVASLEFNDAQKRYEKAEKAYVEAKSDLFVKMERKEKLIEYLCTIIEENELRKAKKLAQLMKELEIESALAEETKDGEIGS